MIAGNLGRRSPVDLRHHAAQHRRAVHHRRITGQPRQKPLDLVRLNINKEIARRAARQVALDRARKLASICPAAAKTDKPRPSDTTAAPASARAPPTAASAATIPHVRARTALRYTASAPATPTSQRQHQKRRQCRPLCPAPKSKRPNKTAPPISAPASPISPTQCFRRGQPSFPRPTISAAARNLRPAPAARA